MLNKELNKKREVEMKGNTNEKKKNIVDRSLY